MSNTNGNDPYANERAMSLNDFVVSLFQTAKSPQPPGFFITREDGHKTSMVIRPSDNEIVIEMDGNVMGRFEEYDGQGYKCAFYQQHRVGIRNGLTKNEALMKAFCYHPLVRFFDA